MNKRKYKPKSKKKIIEVKQLVKTFFNGVVETKVLRKIDLDIYEGEFVGIMGPSGSGKSTCLYQLSLLDNPTSGEIHINNFNVNQLSESEKTSFRLQYVGYVFQQYRILPELTALENVMLPLKMIGKSKETYIAEGKRLLNAVGLQDRYHHLPSELSGGQQQRVAIARALINKPVLLFADEPTANLDTASTTEVLKLFKKFNEEQNQTIVMVSHDPEQIKYFDRVIHLVDGIVDDDGL